MENSNFILKMIRIVFIFGLVGLFINSLNILWVSVGHNFNWEQARKFHSLIDFTKIWQNDKSTFNIITVIEILTIILKINIFLSILKVFKNLNLDEPFNPKINQIIKQVAFLSSLTGFLGLIVKLYIEFFVSNDLTLSTQIGNSEYLWIGALLFMLYTIFNKGYELQSENNLTI